MPRPKNFEKEEVLKKAMQLFWQKGYEATSIQDLVAHTGINKQSLYDTFGDKHTLYLAALSVYRAENEDNFDILSATSISTKTALYRLFENILAEAAFDSDRKGCFMNNATVELSSQNEKVGQICLDNMTSMEKRLGKLIERGQADGEISKTLNAETVAAFLFTAINGLRAVSKITQDKRKLEDIVKTTLSIFD